MKLTITTTLLLSLLFSCGQTTTTNLTSEEKPEFISTTRQLSPAEVANIRKAKRADPIFPNEPIFRAYTASDAVTAILTEGAKQIFKSDDNDFGYLEVGSVVPFSRETTVSFTGGKDLIRPCFEKHVESSILGTTILHFAYCIEATVEKRYKGRGHYILNTYVEVLEQWDDNVFKIDPLYDLKVRVEGFDPENIAEEGEEPIAKIKFAVHSFLDGPAAFDLRATDKFILRGDKTLTNILQIHDLK